MLFTSFSALALMASSSLAATLTVTVGGNGQRTYEPNNIKAELGDIVNFVFAGGNHTVTQSTFASPCTNAGFKSGFRPQGSPSNTFAIMVNSTEPIWVYCAQTGHCQAGMVMAINAAETGEKTFDAFLALAQNGGGTNSTAGAPPPGGAGQAGASGAPVSAAGPGAPSRSGDVADASGGTAPTQSGASGSAASGSAPSAAASGGVGPTLSVPILGLMSGILLHLGLL